MLLVILPLLLVWGVPQPAIAVIQEQQEAPGQMLYQSRHTLKDNTGSSWQLVLFKRIKDGAVENINLRLVGFPDAAEVAHPQGLKITTSGGTVFEAIDEFAEKAPAPNVGQYNLTYILPQLSKTEGVELNLAIAGDENCTIAVPIPVVLEWKEIAGNV
ncbi:MAG: DUF3122 domain-containing protein [Limnospira sp.]